jgi:hypothetical protein
LKGEEVQTRIGNAKDRTLGIANKHIAERSDFFRAADRKGILFAFSSLETIINSVQDTFDAIYLM